VIIHRQLEEPRRADQQGDDADAAEELRADAVFERRIGSAGSRGRRGSRNRLAWLESATLPLRGLAEIGNLALQYLDASRQRRELRITMFRRDLILLTHGHYFTCIEPSIGT